MTKNEINTIWEYFLFIVSDLANTARYVEPAGQENVYSFEFQKIIILSCVEIEKVFKKIAEISKGESLGNMEEYKRFFLANYPNIVDAVVRVSRLGREIRPFENWNTDKLPWWDAYNQAKHGSKDSIKSATCINAIYCISALYILIFYLAKIIGVNSFDSESKFIHSEYEYVYLVANSEKTLPDFQKSKPQRETKK